MIKKVEATYKFFKSLQNLVDQGLIKSIDQAKAFAKQEFGEVSDLMTLQINKIFKNKNQPVVGKKDPVFDNTVETIPFDDTGTPFNPKDPQKVYGKPKEVDTGSPFEDYRRNVLGEGKNKPLDPDDVLPNYNETPGEFARRQTPGSKENILEQMKAAYPQRYNNLTGNETAAELKGIMEKANKTDVPFSTTSKNEKKMMTADELEDLEMELGNDLEAYDFDGTVEDGARILKEAKDYEAYMYRQYKMGKLDPVAGDKSPARKKFLEKKLEEMEASGDSKLMTREEIEELTFFDSGTEIDKAAKLSVNDEIKKGVDEIMKDTSPAALKKSIEVDDLMLKYPGMDRPLAEQIATEINPRKKADIIAMVEQTIKMSEEGKSGSEIIDIFKKTPRTEQAKGGRIKMAKGGLPNILGF